MKVLAVCGSLQSDSANLALLHKVARLAPSGVRVEIFDGIRHLPLFNPDHASGPVDPAVAAWRDAIDASDALLIASPEYGHSLPGALKNAVDWVIGSGELEGKVVGVTASAAGPGRGVRGLRALCDTLMAVRARIVGAEPIVRDDDEQAMLAVLLEALIERAGEPHRLFEES